MSLKNNSTGFLTQKKYKSGAAAQALGISLNTFKKFLAMGELPPPVKVGTIELWLEQDLEAWLIAQNPHLQIKAERAVQMEKFKQKVIAMRAAQ